MSVTILIGGALDRLAAIPDRSINCCVTSPPYYGLRDYGTATWAGGDLECDHLGEPMRTRAKINANAGTGVDRKNAEGRQPFKAFCGKCGARRIDDQIGLEETPEEYIAKLVAVFHQVRRCLSDDGTLWVNIGDSYASRPNGSIGKESRLDGAYSGHTEFRRAHAQRKPGPPPGLKHKDLIGIPWMLAFALRADGWYLRQEIIWNKPNPMPESVQDRCTKAHEHVFLLSKSAEYHFDAEAIAEPAIYAPSAGRNKKEAPKGSFAGVRPQERDALVQGSFRAIRETRNKRSVWNISTVPSSIKHFAMMPPELARTCILAGCPVGGTVLDPFGGAGTTALVADQLKRSAVMIELSPAYAQAARDRLEADSGMFSTVVAA